MANKFSRHLEAAASGLKVICDNVQSVTTAGVKLRSENGNIQATANTNGFHVGANVVGTGGGMTQCLGLENAGTIPSTNPASGVYIYSQSGVLKIRGAGGAIAIVGPNLSGPVALTDAATIATNASLGSYFRVTLDTAGATRALGNPTNAYDGQRLTWEIAQDGTGSRALTLDTKFALGTDITAVTLTTTASKRDFLGAIYNSATDKFYVVSFVKGY